MKTGPRFGRLVFYVCILQVASKTIPLRADTSLYIRDDKRLMFLKETTQPFFGEIEMPQDLGIPHDMMKLFLQIFLGLVLVRHTQV